MLGSDFVAVLIRSRKFGGNKIRFGFDPGGGPTANRPKFVSNRSMAWIPREENGEFTVIGTRAEGKGRAIMGESSWEEDG